MLGFIASDSGAPVFTAPLHILKLDGHHIKGTCCLR